MSEHVWLVLVLLQSRILWRELRNLRSLPIRFLFEWWHVHVERDLPLLAMSMLGLAHRYECSVRLPLSSTSYCTVQVLIVNCPFLDAYPIHVRQAPVRILPSATTDASVPRRSPVVIVKRLSCPVTRIHV